MTAKARGPQPQITDYSTYPKGLVSPTYLKLLEERDQLKAEVKALREAGQKLYHEILPFELTGQPTRKEVLEGWDKLQ